MFPSAIRRFFDAAVEVADAMLAPELYAPADDEPRDLGEPSPSAGRGDPSDRPPAHPHRRRPRGAAPRGTHSGRGRRAGAIAAVAQPCTTPLAPLTTARR